jgi:hypothetical protein
VVDVATAQQPMFVTVTSAAYTELVTVVICPLQRYASLEGSVAEIEWIHTRSAGEVIVSAEDTRSAVDDMAATVLGAVSSRSFGPALDPGLAVVKPGFHVGVRIQEWRDLDTPLFPRVPVDPGEFSGHIGMGVKICLYIRRVGAVVVSRASPSACVAPDGIPGVPIWRVKPVVHIDCVPT